MHALRREGGSVEYRRPCAAAPRVHRPRRRPARAAYAHDGQRLRLLGGKAGRRGGAASEAAWADAAIGPLTRALVGSARERTTQIYGPIYSAKFAALTGEWLGCRTPSWTAGRPVGAKLQPRPPGSPHPRPLACPRMRPSRSARARYSRSLEARASPEAREMRRAHGWSSVDAGRNPHSHPLAML